MKTICSLFVIFLLKGVIGGVERKSPAFAKPMYSDSYLPAAMQVIFHAVEQLKFLNSENGTEKLDVPTLAPTKLIGHTAQYQETGIQEASTVTSKTTTQPNEDANGKEDSSMVEEMSKGVENLTDSSEIADESIKDSLSQATGEIPSHQEEPEVNEETPETNYELPEDEHGVQETNQEVPEENQESYSSPTNTESTIATETTTGSKHMASSSLAGTESIVDAGQKEKEASVDSVVQNLYEILKPTQSAFIEEEAVPSEGSKIAAGVSPERLEEEDDDNRFTRLGEKVTQVPRPSLINYLQRSEVSPSTTLQQLASLYDSLSKDARKQGFGKYTGYSDEILNTLETSAEGGMASQLRNILEMIVKRNDLTRNDAKSRTSQAVRDLDNPSSLLNKELRPLYPLRYSP